MNAQNEFKKICALAPTASLHQEGGKPVALLQKFKFRAAGLDRVMSLLLVPFEHSGYITRLFFESKIDGVGQNWNQHSLLGRTWWAPSWKDVPSTLSWPNMLCAHLRAVE